MPRAFIPFHEGWSWFPIRRTSGELDEIATAIRSAAEALAPVVEQLPRAHPTRGKPIVTGFSQGGMLSFALAVEHGELVHAALPLGGRLPQPLWPEDPVREGETPPILAFHGESDERVAYKRTKRAVGELERLGYAVELHSYAGVGHTISPTMYADFLAALRAQLDDLP